ncbi:hypothetical protein K439DRAFT_246859 [Ramaria rubella]|nr:hypothetical protein K439DRAFT_246859 [Ramaria rubella]
MLIYCIGSIYLPLPKPSKSCSFAPSNMASSSSVNPAALYRPLLYGTMLCAILTGVNICQTYVYVSSNSDRRLFKGILIFLVLFDLLGTLVTTLLLDHNVIGAFAEPIGGTLNSVPSYYFLDNIGTVIIATTAQSYIAWIIYKVDHRWWPLAVLILVGVLGELGIGIFVVNQTAHLKSLSSTSGGSYHLMTGIWPAIASFVDIIATIGLCTLLHTVRTPFKSTNHLINRIMFNLINRGILITIMQLLFVALWFAQPTTLNWIPFYFSTGKLYLTTLLALLNMRGRTQDNMDSFDGHSFTIKNNFGRNTNQNGTPLAAVPAVHIGTTVDVFHEYSSFPTDTYKTDETL